MYNSTSVMSHTRTSLDQDVALPPISPSPSTGAPCKKNKRKTTFTRLVISGSEDVFHLKAALLTGRLWRKQASDSLRVSNGRAKVIIHQTSDGRSMPFSFFPSVSLFSFKAQIRQLSARKRAEWRLKGALRFREREDTGRTWPRGSGIIPTFPTHTGRINHTRQWWVEGEGGV